jgi:hypothetical protein
MNKEINDILESINKKIDTLNNIQHINLNPEKLIETLVKMFDNKSQYTISEYDIQQIQPPSINDTTIFNETDKSFINLANINIKT